MAAAATAAAREAARHSGKFAIHPLLPGVAQLAAEACTGRLVPTWRPRAQEILSTWEKLAFCMPRYTEFLQKTNRKDLKRVHVFMNEAAQAKLGEFYLCCALRLRPNEVEACGEDAPKLLNLAQTVANDDVEPFFQACREFVAGYDSTLHKRLNETTIWREVQDGGDALFWHHSFDVAAPTSYGKYCDAVLPPRAEWPASEDTSAIEALISERAAPAVAEGGTARVLAEEVYQQFLEASVTPIQCSIRTALIDHGVMMGEVTYRPDDE